MNNSKINRFHKLKTIHIIILTIGVLLLILAGYWAWNNFSPKPLGSKLEYIGKEDYGCIILFCDSGPSSTYYYATDMSLEEVKKYFGKASASEPNMQGTNSRKNNKGIILWSINFKLNQSQSFLVDYYKDGKYVASDRNLQTISKEHLISIDAKDYLTIKSSL
jgi:hypothetical protein